MQIEIADSILNISQSRWERLNRDRNPFTSHAFLSALEVSGAVGGTSGWLPRYLMLSDSSSRLLAALPMYEKHHSWGEYVFDWAWANAWQQYGLVYYPKLVVAVPFTPATGRRLLVAEDQDSEPIIQQLLDAAICYAKEAGYSSLHFLFPTDSECRALEKHGLLIRHDVQFHWQNRGYANFEDFLAGMTSRKRKKIVRERKRVIEMGIEFKVISGEQLSQGNMDQMYEFYLSTIMAHGSNAYLNGEFFRRLAVGMADNVVLIEAHKQGKIIAAALNIRHDKVLYGRYWGCTEEYHSLHFETCYYQAIDYCIGQGLSRFEGGAQGEHKLSRGFLPVITCSAHWMSNTALTPAIVDFLEREKKNVAHYQQLLNEHSPFRNAT